ncbi:MAG: DUF86 domain-containing protein, partial [Candidatus Doudnabacteria bacterium]|nr:DUF86 domain-containing protein [Candidatus Doudnabacteria bacterium]
MLKAIEAINSFVSGIEYTDLEKDFMRKSAVMAQLTILGEAAKSLSEEFQLQYKGIEWHKVS